MSNISPRVTPTPSEATLSGSEHEEVSANDMSLHDGTSVIPDASDAVVPVFASSAMDNIEQPLTQCDVHSPSFSDTPQGPTNTTTSSDAVDSEVPETGGSIVGHTPGSEAEASAATGKRKDRSEEERIRPEVTTVAGAHTGVEVESPSKKRRLGSDGKTQYDMEATPQPGPSSTSLNLQNIVTPIVTQTPAQPELSQPSVSNQQDVPAADVVMTRKAEDGSDDQERRPGDASSAETTQNIATASSSTSALRPTHPTANSTENAEGEVHTVKKPRLDIDASSQNITPSASDLPITIDTTGSTPNAETKLSPLLTLPLELIAEILILTGSPQYVLATARSCKALCHTLLSPNAEFIWREARKGPGCTFQLDAGQFLGLGLGNTTEKKTIALPDPPKQFFGEPAYAAFLFDSGKCECCQNETSVLYRSFALRYRLCKKNTCNKIPNLTQINSLDPLQAVLTAVLPTNETDYLKEQYSSEPGFTWPDASISYYRVAEVQAERVAHAQDHLKPDYAKNFQRRQQRNKEWMEFCVQLYKWNKIRAVTFNRNVTANDSASKTLASKYGWEREELMNTIFGPYFRHKNKVIEKINEVDVQVMKDEIESRLLSLNDKRDRRNGEMALMNNRKDIEKAYNNLRSSKAYPYLPSLQTFRKLPVVEMLQSAESPSPAGTVYDTLTKDKMVKDLLASQLKKWTENAKKDLGAILGFPKTWKNASKNILHPVERVTARFLCTRCKRVDMKYRADESLDFAGACLHECGVGNEKSARLRKGKKAIWESKNFVKDGKAIKVLQKAVNALGFAEDRDGGNYLLKVGFALVCTSCEPYMVLDSRNIIGHSHRHDDMQSSFTTPLEDIVAYMGGFPYEYGLVQKLLGSSTAAPDVKQEIDRKNYGCRHCLREKQVTDAALAAAATSADEGNNSGTGAQGAAAPTAAPPSASSSALKGPQIQLSSLVYRMHDLGTEGPHDKPPQLFIFNGMRSHLKAKHGIETIRDEDIFCFEHPGINI